MEDNKFSKIIMVFVIIVFSVPVLTILRQILPFIKLSPLTIILIILGVIIAWIIATYNKFITLGQKVRQAQSGIDVYLKQRFDLIPNLVETVKGYTKYEKEIMENITRLRQDYESRNDQDIRESQNLNDRYTKILAMVENYPELKASEAFLKLQKSLSKIESQLQASRRIYNSEVTEFNTNRYKFPSNIIASICGFNEIPLFEIEEYERENVNIDM